ncbi:hypothetical protein [Azospirillum halopraeferens]|uniref:hypothetical protein n=1 Tax=Azospirillum halopraeferens TaxID=34010 RepID=UPI00041FA704|nr:hypothetical protein [Azospirillum halopraeferens]
MRGWMLPAALAVALAALPATAQTRAEPGSSRPAESGTSGAAPRAERIIGSNLAGVAFTEPPFPLADDGTYAAFMNEVASSLGRKPCEGMESFGWEFPADTLNDQQRTMDRIFQTTMQGFAVKGFTVKEVKTVSLPDPEMVAYTAEKDRRSLLLVWAPLSDSALLLICGPRPK